MLKPSPLAAMERAKQFYNCALKAGIKMALIRPPFPMGWQSVNQRRWSPMDLCAPDFRATVGCAACSRYNVSRCTCWASDIAFTLYLRLAGGTFGPVQIRRWCMWSFNVSPM